MGQGGYRQTTRAKVFAFLDEHGDRQPKEISEATGTKRNAARMYRREWLLAQRCDGGAQCIRCGYIDDESNAVWGDLCLWCRLEMLGFSVRDLFQSGAMQRLLGRIEMERRQFEVDRKGPEKLEARLRRAVAEFYNRHERRLPRAVLLNPIEETQGRQEMARLGLDQVSVEALGGVLLPEIWLEVSNVG